MKIRHLIAAAALSLAAFALPVQAAQVSMCAPDVAGGIQGPRTVGGTLSQVPSGTIYNFGASGCALIQLADIGYFLSQGYTQQSSQNSFVFNTGVATSTTDFVIGTLPPKAYIQAIIFSNSVAGAVTGGISIGTTANGTNIVAAQAVGASTDVAVVYNNILLPVPVTTGLAAPLHMAAVTAWNSANVTVTVVYAYY